MTPAPVDPIDLPEWALWPMLAVGFTLDELRAVPFPVTEEERAECEVIDLASRRRRALMSAANERARAL